MDRNGRARADHVLNAIGWLDTSERVGPGDVVCVPVGFLPTMPQDARYLQWLGDALGRLGEKGVLVVAAAGNDGHGHPIFPAGFASPYAGNPPRVPLVSVGALNPNGVTRAYFSNYGDWVTEYAIGVSCVSTFPKVDATANPELVDGKRETADPDDFRSGFCRWSGTSFAAALFAAHAARHGFSAATAER
jgi:subtilisin family serine protease